MRLLATLAATVATLVACPAQAWGPIGHRVTAQIAQDNISGQTRARVREILGGEDLPEASTWPDEQRSNPDSFWQETASPLHFVTLPQGRTADALQHPPEGDAAIALERFTVTLRDPAASREDKALALRFIVHLVPDLHMPLHAGKAGDRGGNDLKVLWFDAPQNLHWVWDEGIIVRQQLSYSEYAQRLENRTTPAQVLAWWDPRPATWIDESIALRDELYPPTSAELGLGTLESPVKLSFAYEWRWRPTLELRLQQAGIRLAAYLDWVFAKSAAD